MSAEVDATRNKLGQELAGLLQRRGVEYGKVRAIAKQPEPAEASWFVGSIKGSYRIGQSVCLACGFGLTFVLEEQRRRPRYCGGCGEKIARYLDCRDGNLPV